MKSKYINQRLWKLLCLPFMLAAISACTRENMVDCDWISAQLTVVVKDVEDPGKSADPSDVHNVRLYVYNKEGYFLDEIQTSVNTIVQLNYPKAGPLHIIAVGNIKEDLVSVSRASAEGTVSGGAITLIKESIYKESQLFHMPSDLFFGYEDVPNEGKSKSKITELPITRIVSSANLTIRGLKSYAASLGTSAPDGNDKYTAIFETNFSKVDFTGTPSGGLTDFKPVETGSFNVSDEYKVANFNMISSRQGENVTVKIYKNDELIDSVSIDKDGNPLKAVNGKLLNVLIDYNGKLTVSVSTTDWGKEAIWEKEFN